MTYDKSHIPAMADDVVNGLIDEATALAHFSEDLQQILRIEIGKRLSARGYDRENIGNTTDKGIPYLADDIVLGMVDEEAAFKSLFKVYHKRLTGEITKRREDEVLWKQARTAQTIEMFEKYLDTYNDPDSSYVGRYVSRADESIKHIANDDKEWAEAKKSDTEEAYLHYLDIYDKPAPSYKGKYIKDVKAAILKLKDENDWRRACDTNTSQSYSEYLSLYDKKSPEYIGIHVEEARLAILRINDEKDWSDALKANSVTSYESYLKKYDLEFPAYTGQHVDEAKQAIMSLIPPLVPNPRIKDDEFWTNITKINTIEAYKEYLKEYGHASVDGYVGRHVKEAEWEIRHIIDEDAWEKAKSINTIDSYQQYINTCDANDYPNYHWEHYNAAQAIIENLRKTENSRSKEEKDNADWNTAKTENTVQAYSRYLKIHENGIHKEDALDAIDKLEKQEFDAREEMDWQSACESDTLSAYESFVEKYGNPSLKYKSAHLDAAEKKVVELTPPPPVPKPIKWWKWICAAVVLVLAWLTFLQWHDRAWPFDVKPEEETFSIVEVVEQIDSLQWAIDNKDISLLTKYAEIDSIRAYYPLALALNAQDSVANLEKTLHWLDLVLDPDVNSLHQNIINDIQEKELGELRSRFNAINPNEKDADRKYLEVYKDYVSHFERLATHIPRIRVQDLQIEQMAEAQIADRKNHDELRTSILREWEAQQSRLETILSKITENGRKAYLGNK